MADVCKEIGGPDSASKKGESMILTPDLPPPWHTAGYLYSSGNHLDLGEDMFEASLPNGLMIAAGWSEEGVPDGHYLVSVTDGLRYVVPPYRTCDVCDAESYICQIAHDLTVRRSVASSNGCDISVDAPFRPRKAPALMKEAKSTFSTQLNFSVGTSSVRSSLNRSVVTLELQAAGH